MTKSLLAFSACAIPVNQPAPAWLKVRVLTLAMALGTTYAMAVEVDNVATVTTTSVGVRPDGFQIREITAKGLHADNLRIPYFESANMDVAMRINDYIYLEVMEAAAPGKWAKSFAFPERVDGFYELDYRVIRNDDKVLSLKIDGMTCGSSCWPYHVYYSFDAGTGRRLMLNDLLTPGAVKQAGVSFNKQLVIAAKKWNAKIQEEQTKRRANWQTIELPYPVGGKADSDWNPAFLLKEHDLSIFGSADYKGYEQYEYSVALAKQDASLTAYGKYIFTGGQKVEPENKAQFDKLLHGHIGTSLIRMKLNQPSSVFMRDAGGRSISGYYFYDKYRKVIPVEGVLEGANKIELKEYGNGNHQATMTLVIEGEKLVGKWVLNRKVMDMEVSAF